MVFGCCRSAVALSEASMALYQFGSGAAIWGTEVVSEALDYSNRDRNETRSTEVVQ